MYIHTHTLCVQRSKHTLTHQVCELLGDKYLKCLKGWSVSNQDLADVLAGTLSQAADEVRAVNGLARLT